MSIPARLVVARILVALLGAWLGASTATAALNVAVEASPDPVRPGEVVDVRITVSNDGGVAETDVVLESPVPADINTTVFFTGLLSLGGDCPATVSNNSRCDLGEVATWNLGTIPAGGGVTVSFPPTVAAATADGTLITFVANVSDLSGLRATSDATVEVQAAPALELALEEDRDPVAAGQELTYTLRFGHVATATVSPGASLGFELPAGATFVSATDGGSLVGSTVEWALGTLLPGDAGQRQVTVEIDPAALDGALAGASATVADTGGEEARAVAVTRVSDQASLELAMLTRPDPVRPGEMLEVEVTVTNPGFVPVAGVLLEVRIPQEQNASNTFNGVLSGGGLCPGTVTNNSRCDARERATWDLGTIAAGTGVTVVLPPLVAAGIVDGTLISFDAHVMDALGSQRTLQRTVHVDAAPALELALAEDRDPVGAGEELTYTLRFGHVATATVSPGAALSFGVPEGSVFVSASDGGTLVGDRVEWPLGTLLPGVAGERRVTVEVDPGALEGSLLAASALLADTDGNEARARTVTRVSDQASLALAMLTRPDPVRPGEMLEVEVTVTNPGLVPAAGVLLEVRIPQEQNASNTFNGVLSDGGLCPGTVVNNSRCDARERATWDLGTIAAGSGVTVVLPPLVAAGIVDGTLVSFDADLRDGAGSQRTLQRTVHVDAEPALELAVAENRDPVGASEELTYTLRFGHVATATVSSGASLSFELPAGSAFVSASDGGALVGDSVEWALGTLLPGAAGERRVTLEVDPAAAEGSLLAASALLTDSDGNEARARTVTRVEESLPLELAMLTRPDPVRPGEMLEVEVTVTNPGFLPVAGVELEVRIPQEQNASNTFNGLLTGGGLCPGTVTNNSRCDAREFATWALGTIQPGGGVTVVVPPLVAAGIVDGTLVGFDARLRDGTGVQRTLQRTAHVDAAPALELALAEDLDPVAPGQSLTYTLDFGHVDTTRFAPGTVVRLELADGLAFASATGGGAAAPGNAVEWALGTLDPGDSGELRATVQVDAGVAGASLLESRASIIDTDTPAREALARTVTRVEPGVPLDLAVVASPEPVAPGFVTGVQLSVTNSGALALGGVLLEARIPPEIGVLPVGDLGTGTCPGTVVNNSRCDAREYATWDLGSLDPGEEVIVDLPAPIAAATGEASIVGFDVVLGATDVQRTLQTSVVVDNCPQIPNADQANSDAQPRGDACLCGDQTGNGALNVSDILGINAAIFDTGLVTPLCDANNDGLCNIGDILGVNADIFSANESTTCIFQTCPDLLRSCP